MRRTLRLLRLFWGTSIAAEMEYRSNFLMSAFTSIGGLVGAVFGLHLFYRGGILLGGWRWEEALMVLGWFTVLTGVSRTLLTANLGRIVDHVQRGTLDFVLLKPVDAQFWLSTRRLSPWGIPDLVFGLGLVLWAGVKRGVSLVDVLVALVPLAGSVVTLYSLWFILATTTIWYVKIYNVTEVLNSLLEAGRFPVTAFPAGLYRFVFTFVVPVAFLTTLPAEVLLGRGRLTLIAFGLGLALALFVASRAFFRFALRYYTSASS
ncbi:MAG: ABC-2 family transporter protein [Pseudomonadota bacterium]|nr:MAG: ABC transporter permease [Pseudomonadota bacterium]